MPPNSLLEVNMDTTTKLSSNIDRWDKKLTERLKTRVLRAVVPLAELDHATDPQFTTLTITRNLFSGIARGVATVEKVKKPIRASIHPQWAATPTLSLFSGPARLLVRWTAPITHRLTGSRCHQCVEVEQCQAQRRRARCRRLRVHQIQD